MDNSQAEVYAATVAKLSIKKLTAEITEALCEQVKTGSSARLSICLTEDKRRGGKCYTKAVFGMNAALGIKVDGNVIDMRNSDV